MAGAATFTTITVSTIIEAVPTIVEMGADITAAARAVFSLSDAYGGLGYNPILDSIFDNDIEAYETTEFFVDMLCCGYIWGAEEYARTYFASDGNEEGQGEVKAKSTEDSDKSNDAKDRNKNPKPSHQDEESTSNNGHGRNKQKEEGVHFEQGKEAKLKFDDDDLVYGPTAYGKLKELQQEAGGKLLTDIGGPLDRNCNSWLEYSILNMEDTVGAGNKIHFDLTYMEDVQGVLNYTGEYKNSVTAGELRYIYENWDRFCNNVKFYFNKKEVLPPWM